MKGYNKRKENAKIVYNSTMKKLKSFKTSKDVINRARRQLEVQEDEEFGEYYDD